MKHAHAVLRVALAVAMVCLSRSNGKAQAFLIEHQVNALPTDLAVTPDGTKAVVRSLEHSAGGGYSDSFQVIRLSDGAMLDASACPVTSPAGHRPTWPSDTIQATNNHAIAIASATTNSLDDTTVIDVVEFDNTAASCIAHHVIGPQDTSAGAPSDLAITPDGGFAIVNSRDWIHVVDMPHEGTILAEFQIGALPAGICDPSFIADSVACTDERAVVVTARYPNGFPGRAETWVYIVDLTTMTLRLEHELSGQNPDVSYPPHDVASTRDGTKAVVVASKVVGLYDLYNASPVAQFDDGVGRTYRINVDSVEVTNDRALVIGDLSRTVGGQTWTNWCVEVFDITSGLTLVVPPYIDPGWSSPDGNHNRAHDLAISPEGVRGFVRTEFDNLPIPSINAPSGSLTALRSPAVANPLAGISQSLPIPVFTSDSVVIAPELDEGQQPVQKAVSIGSVHNGQRYVTYVDFLNIALPSPTPADLVELGPYESPDNDNCIVADLKLTRDQTRVIVRTAAPLGNPGGAGTDFLLFALFPPSTQLQLDATGSIHSAVDCLEVGRDRAITISETRTNLPQQGDAPPWYGDGFIQIIDL